MIALPRSTYYYRPGSRDRELSDMGLLELIDAIQREFPSYGVRRIQAAIAADPALARLEVETWELPAVDAPALAERLLAARADLVGFSAYVWSFAGFLESARRLRRADPEIGAPLDATNRVRN